MKKIVVFCICFLITINCYAQIFFKLKDGTRVEGKLVEKTDDYIKVDTSGVILTYWTDEIESMRLKTQKVTSAVTTIKGNVIFDDYQQGFIRIAAFDNADYTKSQDLGFVDIPNPGPYEITIPPGTKSIVYILGFNDIDNDGPPYKRGHDPDLLYGDVFSRPVFLERPVINNIDLTLDPKRYFTDPF